MAYYSRIFSANENFIPSMPVVEDEEVQLKSDGGGFTESEIILEDEKELKNALEYLDTESLEKESEILSQKETSEDIEVSGDVFENNNLTEANVIPIDAGYADSMISDSLAKDLIRKDKEIETEGNKKQIINVDTLSRSFSHGERVDINLLKGKNLIPYDTGYIKVLARGIIDKPLTVYANDFSLSAVKMIALSGGKSIKVSTVSTAKHNTKGKFKKRS